MTGHEQERPGTDASETGRPDHVWLGSRCWMLDSDLSPGDEWVGHGRKWRNPPAEVTGTPVHLSRWADGTTPSAPVPTVVRCGCYPSDADHDLDCTPSLPPAPPSGERAELIELFRKALLAAHADDWTMDTCAEAAHICAAALATPPTGDGAQ